MTAVTAVLELPPDASAPLAARRFVSAAAAVHTRNMHDDAQLLVSELVTNAVFHGATPCVLTVSSTDGQLRVRVDDGGQTFAHEQAAVPDLVTSSGRGLQIVAAVAHAWGIIDCEPPPGKSVWFVLDADDYA